MVNNTELNELVNENLQSVNEISSDLFKRTINVSKDRNYIERTEKLGTVYFHEFIGSPIFEDGTIKDIAIAASPSHSIRYVSIEVEYANKNSLYYEQKYSKQKWINYNIDDDYYDNVNFPIERKDARILGKIAQKINPETQYKETGKYFKIKGW